jgi:hypothetical protein
MNNSFNFNRFILLFKKHTLEHYKTYLMSAGVLAGIMTLIFSFIYYSNEGNINLQIQQIIFLNFLLLSGTIFTSMIFSDLGDKKKAISFLTLPVSHLEKYLVAWVYSLVVFLVVFIAIFYLLDFTFLTMANVSKPVKIPLINVFSTETMIWSAFPVYAGFHSFFFTGAILFEKLHFIKTAFGFFLLLTVISILNYPLVKMIFNVEILSAPPFNFIRIQLDKQDWRIEPTESSSLIIFSMILLIALVLWTSAFYKLKEKQV